MSALNSRDGIRGQDLLTFDEATSIEQITSHEYRTHVSVEYSYGNMTHGGFLIALVWKTIGMHFCTTLKNYEQPDTTSFHLEFLRPSTVGPITITIKDVRLGRATSVVHATLAQNGIDKCVAYATNSGPKAAQGGISHAMGGFKLNPPLPPISFDKVLAGTDTNWIRYDVPRDPSVPNHALCNPIFAVQRPHTFTDTDPGYLKTATQWLCPRIPEATWSTAQLGMIFDFCIPPLENWYHGEEDSENYVDIPKHLVRNEKSGLMSYDHPPRAATRFYPTVNMTIEVKRQLPPEGEKWLMVRHNTKEVVDGRFDIDATVWDAKGRLIAIGQSFWYVVSSGASDVKEAKSGRLAIVGKGMKSKM